MQHHALLYRAPAVSRETALAFVPLLEASQIEYVILNSFGIDDVRDLTNLAYLTPSSGGKLGIVVITENITIEAEQALLKLLEEPPQTTAFLFCVPESVFLLPTLLSRFSEVTNHAKKTLTPVFIEFSILELKERISIIGSKLTNKDLIWQQAMKQGLIAYLANPKLKLKAVELTTLYYVAEHLLTRGASNKQLFEELALTMPIAQLEENDTLY
jgi:DNA polymerase III delta prime subunit